MSLNLLNPSFINNIHTKLKNWKHNFENHKQPKINHASIKFINYSELLFLFIQVFKRDSDLLKWPKFFAIGGLLNNCCFSKNAILLAAAEVFSLTFS